VTTTTSAPEEDEPAAKKQRLLPKHGKAIRTRRKSLHLSQDKLVDKINNPEVVYKQLVQRLETGGMSPSQLKWGQLVALAEGLQWTLEQLLTALELPIPSALTKQTSPSDHFNASDNSDSVVLNSYDFSYGKWMSAQLPKAYLPAHTSPLNTFFTTSHPAMLASLELHEHLPVGSVIIFVNNQTPAPGNTVFVHDRASDKYAVVTYRDDGNPYAVVSLDETGAFVLSDAVTLGVMRSAAFYGDSLLTHGKT